MTDIEPAVRGKAYALPLAGAARSAEEAGLVDSLLATWVSWVASSESDDLRYSRAVLHYAARHAGLYESRCSPPTSTFFADVILQWRDELVDDLDLPFVNLLLQVDNIPAGKVLIVRSRYGSDAHPFQSPLDELAHDFRQLGLSGLLTVSNLREHNKLLASAALTLDGGRFDTGSVSSLHTSDYSTRNGSDADDDTPAIFTPYIYQKDIPAAESRTIKAQLRSLLTNADLDSRKLEEEAHIMPKRPDAMPMLFSMKMLMLRSLRVYAPDFQLNSSENVFLLDNTFHQAFDLDWLVIIPHRAFLEKVLSRLTSLHESDAEGGGNKADTQSRIESKIGLYDLLEEIAEPYKLSQLPYNVYALRPSNLRKIAINDFPIVDFVEDLDDIEQPETFLARSDGRFHGRDGTPLSPRVFSRTDGQANPIAFILNAANKVIAALQAEDYVLPSGIESDLCLCASIWYHLIRNAPPHRDAFLTALAAATFENARTHRRYKRKKTKQARS